MPSDQDYLQNAGIQDTEASSPGPETQAQPTSPGAETTAAQAQAEMFELMGQKYPTSTEFQFPHGGKNLKVPYNSLVNTYRQAAHMQDKWAEFRKMQQESQTKLQEYDRYKGFYDKYGALQEWSEKNPAEWDRLHDVWQNKDKHLLSHQIQGGQQPQPGQNPNGFNIEPLVGEITQLKSQLSKYDQMLQKMEAQEREAAETKDVDFVKTEVQSFAKEFPEIDVTEPDPDGVPLWAKIVTWGNANGYQSWEPAAHMFLKQRIADSYQARARNEAMKSAKTERMNGVVKRSATPIGLGQGASAQPNIKKMSYAELTELAKSGQFAAGT